MSQPIQRSKLDILKHVYFAPSLCFTVYDLLIIKDFFLLNSRFTNIYFLSIVERLIYQWNITNLRNPLNRINKQTKRNYVWLIQSRSPADFTEFFLFILWIKRDFKDFKDLILFFFIYYKASQDFTIENIESNILFALKSFSEDSQLFSILFHNKY